MKVRLDAEVAAAIDERAIAKGVSTAGLVNYALIAWLAAGNDYWAHVQRRTRLRRRSARKEIGQ